MLIIVEGVDGVGKSTLIDHLKERITQRLPNTVVEVWHKGPPKAHPLYEYEQPLFNYRPGNGRTIICDRWHIGEWIYPELFGRDTQADEEVWMHVDAFLQSRGAFIVHLTDHPDAIIDRLVNRGDAMVPPSAIKSLVQAYHTRAAITSCDGMTYHMSIHAHISRDRFVDAVIDRARLLESFAVKVNPFTTYIGPPTPNYLLIGDVRHHLRGKVDQLASRGDYTPAFMPFANTSGHFLLKSIGIINIMGMGFINACDVDDVEKAIELLRYPPMVALGRNAYEYLNSRGHTTPGVPHPQWVRRFHHGAATVYGETIMSALFDGEDHIKWRP